MPGAMVADLLEHRQADIALGPAPAPERAATIASVPFLRCRLIVVASPGHPLAGRRDLAPSALASERWLLGPPELDPTTGAGLLFARTGIRAGRRGRPTPATPPRSPPPRPGTGSSSRWRTR